MNTKKSRTNLESQDTWDFRRPSVKKPVRNPRVVVSVALRKEEFDVLAKHAESVGKKTSQFIRDAAMEKVHRDDPLLFASASGTLGAVWYDRHAEQTGVTMVSGRKSSHSEEAAVITHG